MDKPYLKITLEDIIADAKKNKRVASLKKLAATPIFAEDGSERKITFLELKRQYCEEYYPEIVPVKKTKESMWDIIANL